MARLNHNQAFLNGCILQGYKNVISWDIYGTGNYITRLGWKKIIDYFLALPLEAYKINHARSSQWFSFSATGYSYIELNRDYLELNSEKIFSDIRTILETKEFMEPPENIHERLSGIPKEEIKPWEDFKTEWEELRKKYDYWIKKKKENIRYNRFRILERDGFKCRICGRFPPQVVLHIDHWIPKAKGGLDINENLVTLCNECNISKLAQIPKNSIEYVRDR